MHRRMKTIREGPQTEPQIIAMRVLSESPRAFYGKEWSELTRLAVEKEGLHYSDSDFLDVLFFMDATGENTMKIRDVIGAYGKKFNIKHVPYGQRPNTKIYFFKAQQVERWIVDAYNKDGVHKKADSG